jgi:thiamine-monophosphate kinase
VKPRQPGGGRLPRVRRRTPGGGEDELVGWLRGRLGKAGDLLGDDAAMLRLAGEWALTTDSQIAGTHFLPGVEAAVVARRLLAVNLSDLAAVGAEPAYALLALAAPPGFEHRVFLRAFTEACRRAGVTLVGGDLARAPELVTTLALLGRRRRRGRWLRRDAARAGDVLYVGGTVAESGLGRLLLARGAALRHGRVELPSSFTVDRAIAGAASRAVRRHLLPAPQLGLSAELARRRRCACIDVSDGLARDLGRLAAASGVGATVELAALPLPADAARLATRLAADLDELALGGGEDYVLLFSLPASSPAPAGCAPIGRIERRPGLRLRREGRIEPLPAVGWDHLAGATRGREPRRRPAGGARSGSWKLASRGRS